MDIIGGGGGAATDRPRKRKTAAEEVDEEEEEEVDEEEEEEEEEGVIPVAVVAGSKHGDGSIFKPDEHPLHELYHLHDTRETRLEPMRVSDPTDICHPNWISCKQHVGCAMMQIFSLKLTRLPRGAEAGRGPIQLYGFMAARDLLDPLRNYVFNRSREDPFTIQDLISDPFIYLSGPQRGIYLQCPVLIEYYIRIKRDRMQDDLTLIDGAATFSEMACIDGAITNGIKGDHGARVEITRTLLRESVEATVEVWLTTKNTKPAGGRSRHDDLSGLDLSITGFVGRIRQGQEIKMFRGTIGDLCEGKRFVVAVRLSSPLFLYFKAPALGADPVVCKFAMRAVAHGCTYRCHELDSSSTIDVRVTWSNLY